MLDELNVMHEHLYETIEKIRLHADCEPNLMKMYTIDFNNNIYDLDIYYKSILDLCVDMYWNNPSYIIAPDFKGIERDYKKDY